MPMATASPSAPIPAPIREGRLLHPRHLTRPLRQYTEVGAAYVDNMERLLRKFETAKQMVPRPVERRAAQPTRTGVLYYGSPRRR